jgi:hypothetical protein
VKTYDQLTTEEQTRALAHERTNLAGKLRDYLIGNNRDAMPIALRPIVDRFDQAALSQAQGRTYLTGAVERDAVKID